MSVERLRSSWVLALMLCLMPAAAPAQTTIVVPGTSLTGQFVARDFQCSKPDRVRQPPDASRLGKPTSADLLLKSYEARGPIAIVEAIKSEGDLKDLLPGLRESFYRWQLTRRRVHAVFALEIAELGFRQNWAPWLDVLDLARRFILTRPLTGAANSEDDAFELLWHKTALAMLGDTHRPDVLEQCGVAPLQQRIVAAPVAGGPVALVDPWITLQGAIVAESWTIVNPAQLASMAPKALEAFRAAASYPSTRQEALVRQARLLIRLERYDEAVAALADVSDVQPDGFVRYWASLFRGAALHGTGELTGAARAYEDALAQSPGAQSPLVGLMTVAFARGDFDEAVARSAALTSTPVPTRDPWWLYPYGDGRYLEVRLERLRGMVPR